MLAKFNVLSYRYKQILEEVERLTMQNHIAHPFAVPQSDEDFVPRILLRTKMIPEIENEDQQIQEGTAAELQAMVDSIDPLDEQQALEVEKQLEIRKVMHDDMVRSVQETLDKFQKADLFARIVDVAEVDATAGMAQKEADAALIRLLKATSVGL